MKNKGLLIIVSGPSGSGKGTIISELVKNLDFSLSISATTRQPRENEIDGVHYFFKTKEEFKQMIEQNDFLEYAEFCDNFYGTPLPYVKEQLDKGKNVLLEIEVQGALQVKKIYNEAIFIFVIPNNISELRKRLVGRDSEDCEKIEKRIKTAETEVRLLKEYDYVVINNFVEEAVADINKIVDVEKMKKMKNDDLIENFLKEI